MGKCLRIVLHDVFSYIWSIGVPCVVEIINNNGSFSNSANTIIILDVPSSKLLFFEWILYFYYSTGVF